MKKIFIFCIAIIIFFDGCSSINNKNEADNNDTNSAKQDLYYGMVYINGKVIRDNGQGSCGIDPWFEQCTGWRNWWGQTLKANALGKFVIIPDGEDRWVLTNIPDALAKYPSLNSNDFNQPDGIYETSDFASIDFSSTMGCSGDIKLTGDKFNTQVMGTAKYNYINITLSPQATERITGTCGMKSFDYTTSTWRWGVSAIVSGDANDMTILLGSEDYQASGAASQTASGNNVSDVGYYKREFQGDTNPSPENRDHVTATVSLICASTSDMSELVECPWNK